MATEFEPAIVFSVLDDKYCVAKLPPDSMIPPAQVDGELYSVTRTNEETSLICLEQEAPENAEIERNWRVLKVQGPLEFSLKGVLSSMLNPLAAAEISIIALSTYNTDYVLVKQYDLSKALSVLSLAGHRLTP